MVQHKLIAKDIKEFIKNKKITINQFCLLCSLSRPTYYKLIAGKHKYLKDSTIKGLQKIGIKCNY